MLERAVLVTCLLVVLLTCESGKQHGQGAAWWKETHSYWAVRLVTIGNMHKNQRSDLTGSEYYLQKSQISPGQGEGDTRSANLDSV